MSAIEVKQKLSQPSFFKIFPTPSVLKMNAAGIDVSDDTLKYIEFIDDSIGLRIKKFGEMSIPAGAVSGGVINDKVVLDKILTTLAKDEGLSFVRGSLPEEKGYLFQTNTSGEDFENIRSDLEFRLEENVPISPDEAVFDFDLIESKKVKKKGAHEVSVSVFGEDVVSSYVSLFNNAGLSLLSLEIEAQAIARSVVPKGDPDTFMIVDFGKARTGVSIVSEGVLRFTSTLQIGGDNLTKSLREACSVSYEEAEKIKKEKGLTGKEKEFTMYDLFHPTLDTLSSEIKKYITYWQTHEDKLGRTEQKIKKVIFSGRSSALDGLMDYFSVDMDCEFSLADVWVNVLTPKGYLPEISFFESLGYATAIGLALPREKIV